ncbi:MAG TPA: hypothetical protein VIX63_05500 [Vicinamibacterales bacterium]
MPHQLQAIRGVRGVVRWGAYGTAAEVAAYTITPLAAGGLELVATFMSADRFQLTQRPLAFIAPVAGGAWRWPIETITGTETTLRATLGPWAQE